MIPHNKVIKFASIFVFTFLTATNLSYGQDSRFLLSELKASIISAISDAKALSDTEPYFLIKDIDLELQGTATIDGEAGFTIPVFGPSIELGVGGEHFEGDKLAVKLKPSTAVVVGGENIIDLSSLIRDLKKTFKHEKDGSQDFFLASIVYEKTWVLQKNAKGGISFVIASGQVSISKEKRQIIKFTMCETINLVDCAVE